MTNNRAIPISAMPVTPEEEAEFDRLFGDAFEELTLIGRDDDAKTKKYCSHEECSAEAVLARMDRNSKRWYYCKKCGDWTREFNTDR